LVFDEVQDKSTHLPSQSKSSAFYPIQKEETHHLCNKNIFISN